MTAAKSEGSMAKTSKIEWCDSTFNPWMGCTKVSPACDHCYAAVSTPVRAKKIIWGAGAERVRTSEGNWKLPVRWNAELFYQCLGCQRRGTEQDFDKTVEEHCRECENRVPARRRVFCASLADVFDNEVDPQWRVELLQLIADTPNLDWLLLTKRIGNAQAMLDEAFSELSHGLTRWQDAPWP